MAETRATKAGLYLESAGAAAFATKSGVYVEIDIFQVRATLAGVYLEIVEPQDTLIAANVGVYISLSAGAPDGDPSGLTATPISTTQINLAWTDNSSNETGFHIERSYPTASAFSTIASVGAGVTSYSDTSVLEGRTYYYRVRAYNADGYSGYSNTDSALTYPAAPTIGTVSAGTPDDIAVDVTWTDNSAGETSQVIQHTVTSGSGYVTGATVAADVTSGTDSSLNPSTEYWFRVGACNATGCSYSAESAGSVTTAAAPQVVQDLQTQLLIDWDHNAADVSDEADFTDESEYFIEARGTHRIAPPGQSIVATNGQVSQCTIVLDNSTKRFSSLNAAGALYSNIQSGKMYHVRVILKISTEFGGTTWVRVFTGVARIPVEVTLTTQQARTISLDCRGMEEMYLNKRQRSSISFLSSSNNGEDWRISDILAGEGLTGGGTDFLVDGAMYTIPYAWLDNESVIEACWQIAAVSGGRFYARKDGILVYENAAHWLLSPHNTTQQNYTRSDFGSLELVWDETELAEEVTVNYTPYEQDESATIYTSDTIVVRGGQTDVVWGKFDNPVYQIDSITTTAGSPGGIDVSSNVTVTPTYYSNSVKLSIQNTGTVDAYVNVFIAGVPITSTDTQQIVTTSADSYWTNISGRTRNISGNKYLQTRPMAEGISNFLAERQEVPTLKAVMRGCPGNPNRTVGDRITIADAELSLTTETFYITAVEWQFSARGYRQNIEAVRASDLYPYISNYFVINTNELNDGYQVFY